MSLLAGDRPQATPRGVVSSRGSLRWLRVRLGWPRYLLYALAVLSLARTLVAIVAPAPPLRPVAIRASGSDPAAAGYALLFAHAYLAYDASSASAREQALGSFAGGPLDQDAGFTAPSSGSQQVLYADVVQSVALGAGQQRFTVMAATTRLGLVDLAVTVGRDPQGARELVGEPAFVGAPLSAPAVADRSQDGDEVSDAALRAVLARALGNYLAGSANQLQADLSPGAVLATPAQRLNVGQVQRMAWIVPGRLVGVDVQAADRFGAGYELHYELSVAYRDRWYVAGIETSPTQSGGAG